MDGGQEAEEEAEPLSCARVSGPEAHSQRGLPTRAACAGRTSNQHRTDADPTLRCL